MSFQSTLAATVTGLLLTFTTHSWADERSAQIIVENKTNQLVTSVTLIHKFGDVYKNGTTWGLLQDGAQTSPFTAQYTTGTHSNAMDWWLVAWTSANDKSTFYAHATTPANFPQMLEVIQKTGDTAIPTTVATETETACAPAQCGPTVPFAAAAGAAFGEHVLAEFLKDTSTSGFIQHILRPKDERRATIITLHTDGTVSFSSPTNYTEADYTSRLAQAKLASALPPALHDGRVINLVAAHSQKCIDIADASQTAGATVHQWDCLGANQPSQHFTLQGTAGNHSLIASHSGKCLDVSSGSQATGASFHQWKCAGSEQKEQTFTVKPVGDAYQIIANHSGKCMAVQGTSTENGAQIHQSDCLGPSQTNQLFHFRDVK